MRRRAIPKNPFERFRHWLLEMDHMYGLHSDADVGRAVEILLDTLDKSITSGRVKNQKQPDIRIYILVFKSKYVELSDREYKINIRGQDIVVIKKVCDMLRTEGCSVDDYLCWFFDEFLPGNPKLCPPTIKSSCSEVFFERFLFVNKDKIKYQKERDAELLKIKKLTQEARILYRETGNNGGLQLVKDFRDSKFSLRQLEIKMDEFKDKVKGDKNGLTTPPTRGIKDN